MFKKVVWLFGIAVLAAVGAKAYLTFSVYSMLEQIKKEYADSASLNYEWISVDYNGNVIIENMSLTFFKLKRSLSVSELALEFGNASNIISYVENFSEAEHKQDLVIKLNGASLPIKGKSLRAWVEENYGTEWLVPSDIYSCDVAGLDLLKQMGVDEINFDLSFAIKEMQGRDMVDLIWDIDQTGRFIGKVGWEQPNQISTKGILNGQFQLDKALSIVLEYRDEGFIRRIRNMCDTSESGLYAEVSSLAWQMALASIGWQMNEGLQGLYRDYVSQGGVIRIELSKPANMFFDKIGSIYGLNVVDLLGFKAAVNQEQYDDLVFMADEAYFRAKIEQATPRETVKTAKTEYRATYRETATSDLKKWVDRKVRIQLKDGKVYEGILQNVVEHKVDMLVNVAGGTVVYSLKPHGIEKAEVWR